MKNAFLRIGYTSASLLIAGGLLTANAETRNLASVTLSQPVEVGSTTLPSGHYTISTLGDDLFRIHSDNGATAIVTGHHIDTNNEAPKTEIILKQGTEGLRLDQLRFEGQTEGFEFGN